MGARVFQPVSGKSVLPFLGRNAGHAVPKPRRGGFTLAQGKRSAALGHNANVRWPEGQHGLENRLQLMVVVDDEGA
jgi:hypothetical protein